LNVYVDETGEHIMAFNKRFPQKEEFVYWSNRLKCKVKSLDTATELKQRSTRNDRSKF
jgi:hypothetical protein